MCIRDSDGPVPSDPYVQRDVRLTFDVDRLGSVLRLLPALRCLVCSLRVEILDKCIGHGWPNIGEAPGDALIVADDDIGHSGQRNARHIQSARRIAALEMRFVPQVRHLVPEVHIIRQQRFPGDRVRS